jgi:signal transduction histidine kinase
MAVGLAALFGVFAYVAIDSANRSSDAILEERVTLAQLMASNVEGLLATGKIRVTEVADKLSMTDLGSPSVGLVLEELARSLDDLMENPGGSSAGLFDGRGTLLAGSNADLIASSFTEIVGIGQASAYRIVLDAAGRAVISDIRSIPSAPGPDAILVAQFRPGPAVLRVSPDVTQERGNYRVELIASGGEVVGSSDPGDRELTSRHSDILAGLVDDHQSRAVEHVPVDTGAEHVNHVVAFAPLEGGALGIVVEQPEDVALALPNDLRRRILLISGIGLAIGLVVAWITARQVVRPLEILTRNARSIAEGRLDQPIAPSGQDEIRRLGESFEAMRARLSGSVSELERWSAELERRVLDRTGELEARNRERDLLLDKVITAQEDERTRVARELHDQVGQSLTALVMQLGAAERILAEEESNATAEVRRAREGLSDTIDEVRRLMSDLRPSILDDMGLSSAIRWYAEQRLSDAGIRAMIKVDQMGRELHPATEISVFRVFQESINNAIKHAHPNNVSVSFDRTDNHLECEVSDDGIGFDPQTAVPGSDGGWAVGLIGMRERVNLLNGTIDIQSSPGSGTKVSFRIPAKLEHAH